MKQSILPNINCRLFKSNYLTTILCFVLLNIDSRAQDFEGSIYFSVHREWFKTKDSLEFKNILKHIFISKKDFIKKEVVIGKDKIVQRLISNDTILTNIYFAKDMQNFIYSDRFNSTSPVSKMPKISMKLVNKTQEKEIILGYECLKYIFESTCMGQTDLCYFWITKAFKPNSKQEINLFQEYFLPDGLVLKKEIIQKNYVKTIEKAIFIKKEDTDNQFLNILNNKK